MRETLFGGEVFTGKREDFGKWVRGHIGTDRMNSPSDIKMLRRAGLRNVSGITDSTYNTIMKNKSFFLDRSGGSRQMKTLTATVSKYEELLRLAKAAHEQNQAFNMRVPTIMNIDRSVKNIGDNLYPQPSHPAYPAGFSPY